MKLALSLCSQDFSAEKIKTKVLTTKFFTHNLKTDQYGEAHEFASPAINQLTFAARMCKVVESQLQFPTFDRILDLEFC